MKGGETGVGDGPFSRLEPPFDALACMTEYARARPHHVNQLSVNSSNLEPVAAQGKGRQARQVCPAHSTKPEAMGGGGECVRVRADCLFSKLMTSLEV